MVERGSDCLIKPQASCGISPVPVPRPSQKAQGAWASLGHIAIFRLRVSPPTLSAENAERMGHPSVSLGDQKE